jgi:hypothetical protein
MKGLCGPRVTIEDIKRIPVPQSTRTYTAVPYVDLIGMMKDEIENQSLTIVEEEYSMSKEGKKLFGVMTLEDKISPNTNFMLALRSSYDKSLTNEAYSGEKCFVCTNMMVMADNADRRKHYGNLSHYELMKMFRDLISKSIDGLDDYSTWVQSLERYPIDDKTKQQLLLFHMYDNGLLSKVQVADLYHLWIKQENPENGLVYEPTLAGLKGAVTQLWNKNSLVGLADRSANLNGYLRHLQRGLEQRSMVIDV